MKIVLAFLVLLISDGTSKAQGVRWIKFIYYGEQLEPHGTLIISVDSLISPKGMRPDTLFWRRLETQEDTFKAVVNLSFGRGIQTDHNTYNAIAAFIREGKYTFENYRRANGFDAGYGIIDSKGGRYYLPDCNFSPFFHSISERLREEKLDNTLAEAFDHHYSFWQDPANVTPRMKDTFPSPRGLPIMKSRFDSLVQQIFIKFQSANAKKNIQDYYEFVLVDDTYAFYQLEDQYTIPLFELFRSNFSDIWKTLDVHGGGSTIFAKNGLMIGGWATKDNFYRIESSCELSSR
jgi:hypothetical protein